MERKDRTKGKEGIGTEVSTPWKVKKTKRALQKNPLKNIYKNKSHQNVPDLSLQHYVRNQNKRGN